MAGAAGHHPRGDRLRPRARAAAADGRTRSGRPRRGMDKDGRARERADAPVGSQSPVRRGRAIARSEDAPGAERAVPGPPGRGIRAAAARGSRGRRCRRAVTRSCSATSPVTKPRRSRPPCCASRGCRRCRPCRSRRRRARPRDPTSPARRARSPAPVTAGRAISRASGSDEQPALGERDEETRHRARGAVAVDRRHLGDPPGRGVHDLGVPGAGRVGETAALHDAGRPSDVRTGRRGR